MNWTPFFVTLIVIILTLYDMFAILFGGIEYSVSKYIQIMGFKSPMISFGCGFLAGHWFGYMKTDDIGD